MALWSWWQRAAEETAQSWCKFVCCILSWHSKDNRFFSTRGNTCRKVTDVATSSMPCKSMCQGLVLYTAHCVCVCVNSLQSCQLFVTLWTVARLCHGYSPRILKWVAMPSSRDLPHPGIEPMSPATPALQLGSLLLSHWGSPYCPLSILNSVKSVCPHKVSGKKLKSRQKNKIFVALVIKDNYCQHFSKLFLVFTNFEHWSSCYYMFHYIFNHVTPWTRSWQTTTTALNHRLFS